MPITRTRAKPRPSPKSRLITTPKQEIFIRRALKWTTLSPTQIAKYTIKYGSRKLSADIIRDRKKRLNIIRPPGKITQFRKMTREQGKLINWLLSWTKKSHKAIAEEASTPEKPITRYMVTHRLMGLREKDYSIRTGMPSEKRNHSIPPKPTLERPERLSKKDPLRKNSKPKVPLKMTPKQEKRIREILQKELGTGISLGGVAVAVSTEENPITGAMVGKLLVAIRKERKTREKKGQSRKPSPF